MKARIMKIRLDDDCEHLPEVNMWLERTTDDSIMLKAKHPDSGQKWNILQIYDDFSFFRCGRLSEHFGKDEISER